MNIPGRHLTIYLIIFTEHEGCNRKRERTNSFFLYFFEELFCFKTQTFFATINFFFYLVIKLYYANWQ